ncbi:MAG: sodium-translocating pyrophosphatase, partial [Alphaproteobacteria bacterium]|nr:sodium-translocating pyrophosphatase [Alphaproteobacteria bacterium]
MEANVDNLIYAAPVASVIALIFGYYKASYTSSRDPGTPDMVEIAARIQEGAMAFLRREYTVLAGFVVVVAGLLALANMSGDHQSPLIAVSFVLGAVTSGAAGWAGMRVATNANVRTTNAARTSLSAALDVAFSGGTVMGMAVTGLALLGLSVLFIVYKGLFGADEHGMATLMSTITGFSMGASSIALFARVGGGIYTKAADVGADLVGKVESGLPEDDPRNPAVIADNVGDNVGDVAGMGADLFESYVGAIVGTMVLGLGFSTASGVLMGPIVLPFLVAAVGIIASIVGTMFVRVEEGGNAHKALDRGAFGSAGVTALLTFAIAYYVWPQAGIESTTTWPTTGAITIEWFDVGTATVIGLIAGVAIGMTTSYYCSMGQRPVVSIANQSRTGAATNIIAGLGMGMESTAIPVVLIAAGVLGAYAFAGLYGIGIAALGMLSTTGIQLAVDAFGPIADNAGGIAEMTHQDPKVRERTDSLDAVGNTTAAIGKGFAIGSAAMTALALFAAYSQQAKIDKIDVLDPSTMSGVFLGAMLPFLFSSMAMRAVGDA